MQFNANIFLCFDWRLLHVIWFALTLYNMDIYYHQPVILQPEMPEKSLWFWCVRVAKQNFPSLQPSNSLQVWRRLRLVIVFVDSSFNGKFMAHPGEGNFVIGNNFVCSTIEPWKIPIEWTSQTCKPEASKVTNWHEHLLLLLLLQSWGNAMQCNWLALLRFQFLGSLPVFWAKPHNRMLQTS